ncbi:carboxypeptidase-like regulatory domain-containing protein [Winogradskyella sp. R77965]|uniref:carboxypeptidase-like regulatory domain-containing protein n=1 Tax=Winogradskyella sp. R77965 TaxID=3093872 RepID=UPI0037DC306D
MNTEKSSDKNEQTNKANTLTDYLGEAVVREFIGTVSDENNKPIENATVTIGNKTTVTDNNGHFKIKDARVNEHFASIEATKEGYKTGNLNLEPKDKINEVLVLLHKESEPCLFWFCKHNHSLPKYN